jgi:hypothetical protein
VVGLRLCQALAEPCQRKPGTGPPRAGARTTVLRGCWHAVDHPSLRAELADQAPHSQSQRALMAPLYVNEGVLEVCRVGVALLVAGPGSDLSEEPAVGLRPAALDFVAAPRCPPGPVSAGPAGTCWAGAAGLASAASWR